MFTNLVTDERTDGRRLQVENTMFLSASLA